MSISTIGQGSGGTPVQHSGVGPPAPASVDAPRERASAAPVGAPIAPVAELPRRAWFDLDGDNRLEPWNPIYGGDGTIIWNVPGDDAPTRLRTHRDVPPVATPATPDRRVDAARGAYERYGDREVEPAPRTSHPSA